MSFSIKCDKCGHVVKFCKSTKKHNFKTDKPIIIYSDGDEILILKCTICGHEQGEI